MARVRQDCLINVGCMRGRFCATPDDWNLDLFTTPPSAAEWFMMSFYRLHAKFESSSLSISILRKGGHYFLLVVYALSSQDSPPPHRSYLFSVFYTDLDLAFLFQFMTNWKDVKQIQYLDEIHEWRNVFRNFFLKSIGSHSTFVAVHQHISSDIQNIVWFTSIHINCTKLIYIPFASKCVDGLRDRRWSSWGSIHPRTLRFSKIIRSILKFSF